MVSNHMFMGCHSHHGIKFFQRNSLFHLPDILLGNFVLSPKLSELLSNMDLLVLENIFKRIVTILESWI